MSLGNRISELISEKKITQKQLAAELNIAPSTLNGYIRDFREPDIATLQQLAKYFGVSIDYLVNYNASSTSSANMHLNESEHELLTIYRCLLKEQQELFIEQGKLLIKMNHKKGLTSSNITLKTGTDKNHN